MPKPPIPPGKAAAVDTKARALKAALPADDTRQTKLTELARAKGGAREPQVALNALPGVKARAKGGAREPQVALNALPGVKGRK